MSDDDNHPLSARFEIKVDLNQAFGQVCQVFEPFGESISQAIGYYVTDPLSHKRRLAGHRHTEELVKSALKLAEEIYRYREEKNIQGAPTELPYFLAVDCLRTAIEEDDDIIRTMWARLFAKASDSKDDTVLRKCIVRSCLASIGRTSRLFTCYCSTRIL